MADLIPRAPGAATVARGAGPRRLSVSARSGRRRHRRARDHDQEAVAGLVGHLDVDGARHSETMVSESPVVLPTLGHARLVLLPGMGADERMYAPLRELVPELRVSRWLPPAGSLADYARAYLDAGLLTSDDFIGGSSFGGFVAAEIAALVRPRGLVLLGSATSPTTIMPVLRTLAPLAGVLPVAVFAHPPAMLIDLTPKTRSINYENQPATSPTGRPS